MSEGNIQINITSGTIVRVIVFLMISALLYILRDVVLIVLAAIIIASAVDPGVRFFERKKIPRAIGVILIYLFMVVLAVIILLFIIPSFLSETSTVVKNIPSYITQINNIIPVLDQSIVSGYVPLIQQIAGQISSVDFYGAFSNAAGIGGNLLATAQNVAGGALDIIIIIVLSFYFSVTKESVEYFLRIITPARHEEYILNLWGRSKKKMGGWLQGQLLLALLMGSLIYPALVILGVKQALLLALFAAILEIIPVFGPTLATVPAVLLGLLDGGVTLGVLVLGFYIIIQQFESNVFYPLVVKKIIGVSPLMVIIALVVGAKLGGVLGIILSVPLSVILMEFIEDIDKKKTTVRNS